MPTFAPSSVSGIVGTTRQSINPQSSVGAASDLGYGDVGSSGAWMIEEQTLNVEYWRFPQVTASGLHLNLSAVSMGLNIINSRFWVRVTASYTRRKSDGIYASAFETRMQQFGYAPDNSDQEGVTYVSDTDSATLPPSALGCDGTIYTAQPYYFRRPWVSATDTEITQMTTSAPHNFATNFFVDPDAIFRINYAFCSDVTNNNPWNDQVGGTPVHEMTPMPGTQISNTYDPDNDYSLVFLPQILDIIADKLKLGMLGTWTAAPAQQVANYEKDRHDYTGLGANA